MRALYTDDIPGAQPTIRYFEKDLYRKRHDEEIMRFGNRERRVIDWYQPPLRHVEPIER